ncbi:MAG: tetratricopeptide repeat protein, partial [Chloroflexia bacterium]
NSELMAKYEPTWERAARDARRVLEARGNPTPIEQARAHTILSQLYTHRSLHETFKSLAEGETSEPDEETIIKAVEHAQEAVRLVNANPTTAIEDRGFDSIVYSDLVLAAIGARNYYHNKGDVDREAEYSKLHDDASARWRVLSSQALSQFEKPQLTTGPLTSCDGAQLLNDGSEALSRGETDRALRLLEEYMAKYPGDPQGVAALGWAQYLAGDLGAALGTMERFEEETPDNPYGPARRAIILLAQGKPEEAKAAITAMVERMQNRPPSTRLQVLVSLGEDLDNLSRKESKAHDGVKAILPEVRRYIDSLPPEVRTDLGWRLILALNNLGSAAIWAEDYEAAERFFEPGLQINGDYVLLRSNLALAKMASGDTPAAKAEYAKAIASADVYLKNEAEGDETEAAATAKRELEAAAEALDSLIEAKPDLEKEGGPLLEELRSAAAKYGR